MFDRIIAKTKSAEGHYSEKDAALIMRKILDAIDYCHTVHNICHRCVYHPRLASTGPPTTCGVASTHPPTHLFNPHSDLKPENFLFKTDAPDAELKIIDFGLSRFEDDQKYMTTRVGTPYCTYVLVGIALALVGSGTLLSMPISPSDPHPTRQKQQTSPPRC